MSPSTWGFFLQEGGEWGWAPHLHLRGPQIGKAALQKLRADPRVTAGREHPRLPAPLPILPPVMIAKRCPNPESQAPTPIRLPGREVGRRMREPRAEGRGPSCTASLCLPCCAFSQRLLPWELRAARSHVGACGGSGARDRSGSLSGPSPGGRVMASVQEGREAARAQHA